MKKQFPGSSSKIIVSAILMLVVVSNCLSAPKSGSPMMPAPAIFWDHDIDPFIHVRKNKQKASVEVFFACDDKPSSDPLHQRYNKGRHGQDLRVGTAVIQLGNPDETWKGLCEKAMMKKRPGRLKRSLIKLDEFGALGSTMLPRGLRSEHTAQKADKQFASSINEQLANSKRKSINIYVHGFYSRFGNSMGTIAQQHYYLGLDGVALGYAWPSQGQLLGGYHADKNNARFTIRHFRLLLEFLATHTDVENINILAHSAGCPVVVDTLRQIRFLHANKSPADIQRRTKIGLVILGAPDGDLDWFINACLDGWMQSAKSVHVYMSGVDRALKFSGGIFEATRTGAAVNYFQEEHLNALRVHGNLSLINVTSTKRYNKLVTGHSYYHMNPLVSSDVLLAMKFGVTPEQRGLVRVPGSAFFTFPEDYIESVKTIARKLYRSGNQNKQSE